MSVFAIKLFNKLPTKTKSEFDLLISLFCLHSKVESNFNILALRFELKFFEKLTISDALVRKLYTYSGFSIDTCRSILSHSYGSVQIMGYNLLKLYEFDNPRSSYHVSRSFWEFLIKDYLTNLPTQIYYFYLFVTQVAKLNVFEIANIIAQNKFQEEQSLKVLERYALLYDGSKNYLNLLLKNLRYFKVDALKEFHNDLYQEYSSYWSNR